MDIMDMNYTFNSGIIYREVKDEGGSAFILAHDPKTGDMYEFNDVGSEIFLLIKDNIPIRKVFDVLTHEYDVTADEIREDVQLFIERFIELGLIRVAE